LALAVATAAAGNDHPANGGHWATTMQAISRAAASLA
jgi:hypothetical protein